MTECEALKLALEALETGLCYVENEDFDNKQKFRGYEHLMPTDAAESIQEIKTAITAIKEALREHAMYEVQRLGQEIQPEQEPVAWRNAALRIGEDLCSVGPFGYYDMTAKQWLDWALSVVTVHALPQPQEATQRPRNCGTGYCSCIECVMKPTE